MSSDVRTYGGWRERRGFGLAGLSGRQTSGALAAVALALGAALIVPSALPVMAVPLLAAIALVGIRVRGEPVAAVVERHAGFRWSRRRGHTSYRGEIAPVLPGALADIRILELPTAGRPPVAVAWSPSRRTVTALVPAEPLGVDLVSAEEVDGWLHGWSDWLTHLGYVNDVAHVAVTVATGPGRLSPRPCPGVGVATTVLEEVEREQGGGSVAQTVISVTVAGAGEQSLESACAALLDVIASAASLAGCGLSLLSPFGVEDLTRWIRGAYDPAAALPDSGADPWDARPTATEERWATYRHDGAVSAGYVWSEPPGAGMAPEVLARLLGPSEHPKRVTLVFVPMPAHEAAREVERQAEAAAFRREYRRRLGRDETARERVDLQRARQAADEQAAGAGVVDVALYAVATVEDEADLATASADLENRAGQSRLRLRRSYGSQAATFATTLGLGYVPLRRW